MNPAALSFFPFPEESCKIRGCVASVRFLFKDQIFKFKMSHRQPLEGFHCIVCKNGKWERTI